MLGGRQRGRESDDEVRRLWVEGLKRTDLRRVDWSIADGLWVACKSVDLEQGYGI